MPVGEVASLRPYTGTEGPEEWGAIPYSYTKVQYKCADGNAPYNGSHVPQAPLRV